MMTKTLHEPDFGKCCYCEKTGRIVRNVIMLDLRSPEPGIGCWSCLECGLPSAGAVAVLCDACVAAGNPLRFACIGSPGQNRRVPIEELTEPFEHDLSKHPEIHCPAAAVN